MEKINFDCLYLSVIPPSSEPQLNVSHPINRNLAFQLSSSTEVQYSTHIATDATQNLHTPRHLNSLAWGSNSPQSTGSTWRVTLIQVNSYSCCKLTRCILKVVNVKQTKPHHLHKKKHGHNFDAPKANTLLSLAIYTL